MNSSEANQHTSVSSQIKQTLCQVAHSRMERVLGATPWREEASVTPMDAASGMWMVKIVINSSDVKFIFKVYYHVDDARHFAQQKAVLAKKDFISDHLSHDFIREYCNLTGGTIKTWLQTNYHISDKEGRLMVNLPNQKPYNIEPYSSVEGDESRLFRSWDLLLAESRLRCCWLLEIKSWKTVDELVERGFGPAPDIGGEIELLQNNYSALTTLGPRS